MGKIWKFFRKQADDVFQAVLMENRARKDHASREGAAWNNQLFLCGKENIAYFLQWKKAALFQGFPQLIQKQSRQRVFIAPAAEGIDGNMGEAVRKGRFADAVDLEFRAQFLRHDGDAFS